MNKDGDDRERLAMNERLMREERERESERERGYCIRVQEFNPENMRMTKCKRINRDFSTLTTRAQFYETFYGCNLRVFVICYSVLSLASLYSKV